VTKTLAIGQLSIPEPRDPLSVLLYVVAGVLLIRGVFGPPAPAMTLKGRKAP
jgi:hypothetical protein